MTVLAILHDICTTVRVPLERSFRLFSANRVFGSLAQAAQYSSEPASSTLGAHIH